MIINQISTHSGGAFRTKFHQITTGWNAESQGMHTVTSANNSLQRTVNYSIK